MKHFTLHPDNLPSLSKEQLQAIDDYAAHPQGNYYEDSPELDTAFLQSAHTTSPHKRTMLQVDTDILTWLQTIDDNYEMRANAILRAAMEHMLHR